MPAIDPKQVEHIAHLARLKLPPDRLAVYAGQLGDILTYVALLNEVNTDGVEPTAHPLPVANVWREDMPGESLGADRTLANAPQRDTPYFKVPKLLDQGSA